MSDSSKSDCQTSFAFGMGESQYAIISGSITLWSMFCYLIKYLIQDDKRKYASYIDILRALIGSIMQ